MATSTSPRLENVKVYGFAFLRIKLRLAHRNWATVRWILCSE
uniref:Uncharacterized protein n=1 Tax=Rhizophora mucronata TaxID=61149 RepID=A0A2P2IUL9_RHIMU